MPRQSEETFPLWLDHVSVGVPTLPEAVEFLAARLGLRATVSAADPEHHSRIFLHRGYLEVSTHESLRDWRARLFFLRFEDPLALRAHLNDAGLEHRFGQYTGVDGLWDDVELKQGGSVPLPILVRRTEPRDVAVDWPPALSEPHRCGAETLAAVHVAVSSLEPALDIYGPLLGFREPPSPTEDHDGRLSAELVLASGRVVLAEGDEPGIAGVVLGVSSLHHTRGVVPLVHADHDPIAWFDPVDAPGLRIGFIESGKRPRTPKGLARPHVTPPTAAPR